MDEYLNKIKQLIDKLLLAGNPLSTGDLIIQTLAGLDSEYNPIMVQLVDKEGLTCSSIRLE